MIITAALNKKDINVDKLMFPMFSEKKPHVVSFEWDYGSMFRILSSCRSKVPGDSAITTSYEVRCREVIYCFIEDLADVSDAFHSIENNVNGKLSLMHPVAIKVELDTGETPRHVKVLSDADIRHLSMGMQLLVGKRFTNIPEIKVARLRGNTISVMCVPENEICNLVSTYLHFLRDGGKEIIDYFISIGKQYNERAGEYVTASVSQIDGMVRILLKSNNSIHRGDLADYGKHVDVLFAMCVFYGNASSYSHIGNGPITGGTRSISSREAVNFCERYLKEVKERLGSSKLDFRDSYRMDVIYKVRAALLLVEMKKESEL